MSYKNRDWKQKYFDALADLENREHHWRSVEHTLRKGLNRLAILSQDGHPELDRTLHNVRTLSRGNDNGRALGEAIEKLPRPLAESAAGSPDNDIASAVMMLSQLLPLNEEMERQILETCRRNDSQNALKLLLRAMGSVLQQSDRLDCRDLATSN